MKPIERQEMSVVKVAFKSYEIAKKGKNKMSK